MPVNPRKAGALWPHRRDAVARALRELLTSCGVVAFIAIVPSAAEGQAQYPPLNFSVLASWDYDADNPWDVSPLKVEPTGVPPEVRELDGRKISIHGLAIPLTWEEGGASEFILTVSADACEFGTTPRINEWILVRMANGEKVQVSNGWGYLVMGTLHVTEKVDNDGRVIELYAIDGDNIRQF